MKTFRLFLLLLSLSSCEKISQSVIFQRPIIETLYAYSVSENTGEVSMDINNINVGITEVGIVVAEHTAPTVNDNKQFALNVAKPQVFNYTLKNLVKGKTYYVRSFYRLDDELVYGNEIALNHQFTGEWKRLGSPILSPDEYIYADDLDLGLSGDILRCYKVNAFNNQAERQIYYADISQWNAEFWGTQRDNPALNLLRFSPIRADFMTNSGSPLTLYGAGYEATPRSSRYYLKTMRILQSNGNWAPYPGADAPTISFGIGKLVYVLENLPNGKLWVFDYDDLSWKNIGTFPYSKTANYVGFDAGERFFMLVEPIKNEDGIKEFYEYDVKQNKWIRRADFIGENRRSGASFVINSQRIFYGLGKEPSKGNGLRDIFEYDSQKNTWKKVIEYPGGGTVNLVAIGSFDRAYIGFGKRVKQSAVGGEEYNTVNDFWEFVPKK